MDKKLNVLIFKFALALGGGERFSLVVSQKLKGLGHQVVLFSNYRPLLNRARAQGTKTKKIYWGKEAGARRYLIEYFLLLSINLVRFSILFAFNKKRNCENIVVLQNLNEKIFATNMGRFFGYKVFWVEHLSIDPWLIKSFLKKSYLKKINNVDKIIVISDTIKKEILNLGVKAEKIETIYNGVDTNEFYVYESSLVENEKKKYGFFKDSKIIGYVGRLHEEKGLSTLINSFYQLTRRFDHLYLILVGEGPERAKLEEQAKNLSIEKRVLFSGYKENVPLFFNMIDIFVLPSKLRESFGIVLIEAMACGDVVVGSDLGGIPEIIKNEINGFLFAPGNEKELTDKLSKVLSDDSLRQKIVSNALTEVKNNFSSEVMIKRIERIFLK